MDSKIEALETIVNAINLDGGAQKHVLFAAAKSVAEEMRRDLDETDAGTVDDPFGTSRPREKIASVLANLSRAVMPDKETDAELALRTARDNVDSLKSHFHSLGQ